MNASLTVPPTRSAAARSGASGTSCTPTRRSRLRSVINSDPGAGTGRTVRYTEAAVAAAAETVCSGCRIPRPISAGADRSAPVTALPATSTQ